ncbi:MAG: hypothetical protein JOY70_02400 [Acidisphaera sp.]|nr:hypothetical protein [Acidisphaera sp.]
MTVFQGSIASGTTFNDGDSLVSPDGLYNFFIDETGAYGSGPGVGYVGVGATPPNLATCGTNCVVPVSNTPQVDLGKYFAAWDSGGNFNVYTSASGTNTGQVALVSPILTSNGFTGPFYATIEDQPLNQQTHNTGSTLVLYQGTYPNQSTPLVQGGQSIVGPITGIDLQSVTYDFAHAQVSNTTNVVFGSVANYNDTPPPPQTQQYNQNVNVSDTISSTFSFNTASTVSDAISSKVSIGIPEIGSTSLSFTETQSTTVSHGQATTVSRTVQYQAGARPEVPYLHEYETIVTGDTATYNIPYTYTGLAHYQGGAEAEVTGTGVFTGGSSGNFFVATYDCMYIKGCPPIPPPPAELPSQWTLVDPSTANHYLYLVPEPSQTVFLPATALLAVLAIRRARMPTRTRDSLSGTSERRPTRHLRTYP